MKTLRIMVAALMAAFAFSCAKSTIDVPADSKGMAVKVRAELGSMTKTTYTEAAGAMKVEWTANDSLSVLTYRMTPDGEELVSCDILVNTNGAGKAGVFEGTLTEVEGDVRRIAFYPAVLLQPVYPGEEEFKMICHPGGLMPSVVVGDGEFTLMDQMFTSAQDPLRYAKDYDIMSGVLDMDGGDASVDLVHQGSLLKLDLALPEDSYESVSGSYGMLALIIDVAVDALHEFDYEGMPSEDIAFDEDGNVVFVENFYDNYMASRRFVFIEEGEVNGGTLEAYVTFNQEFVIPQGTQITVTLADVDINEETETVLASKAVTAPSDLAFRKGEFNKMKMTLE